MNSWKIERSAVSKSIFDKKKLNEYPNNILVDNFICHKLGSEFDTTGDYYEYLEAKGIKNELSQLEIYKKKFNKKNKSYVVTNELPSHGWGRIFPTNGASLSTMHRGTRHALCIEKYIDIDMVNAHTSIVYQVALKHGMDKPTMKEYIKDPTKHREKLMSFYGCDKAEAKNLYIRLLFGGSFKQWRIDCAKKNCNKITPFEKEFANELNDIKERIYIANQHIKDDVLKYDPLKWETEAEAKNGVMSLWCQTLERVIQETVISYLVKSKKFNLNDIIPCQDGFMILKELYYNGLLKDCTDIVLKRYDIDINFLNKPFDEAINIPKENLGQDNMTYFDWVEEFSTKNLAKIFLETFSTNVVKVNGVLYVYYKCHNESDNKTDDQTGGRWYKDGDAIGKIFKYISEDIFLKEKKIFLEKSVEFESLEEDKQSSKSLFCMLVNHTTKTDNIKNIIKHIESSLEDNKIEIFDQNPFYLGFENGVYELDTGIFREYKYNDYMTISTGYPYRNLNDSEKELQNELDNILCSIQPIESHRNLVLQILASSLDGKLYQKLFLFNGRGGNGKGLIASLMEGILGKYAIKANNGLLKHVDKPNSPSPDLLALKGKRYINFTEVDGILRLSMLRNISGGSTFSARDCYIGLVTFKLMATIMFEFNNDPEFSDKAMEAEFRRLVYIRFNTNFTDDQQKLDAGTDTAGIIRYAKANPYYESQEFITAFKYVFLHKLLTVYREKYQKNIGIIFDIPAEVLGETKQFINDQHKLKKIFETIYQKSDNKNSKLYLSKIWNRIKDDIQYKNLSAKEKKQNGRDDFYEWIKSIATIELDKSNVQYIKGFEEITDDMDNDIDTDTDDTVKTKFCF